MTALIGLQKKDEDEKETASFFSKMIKTKKEGVMMESYKFLLMVAIILLSTKVFGLLSQKVNMPQVVGALLVGIILGPGCLNVLEEKK